jgi:hypothetical protein
MSNSFHKVKKLATTLAEEVDRKNSEILQRIESFNESIVNKPHSGSYNEVPVASPKSVQFPTPRARSLSNEVEVLVVLLLLYSKDTSLVKSYGPEFLERLETKSSQQLDHRRGFLQRILFERISSKRSGFKPYRFEVFLGLFSPRFILGLLNNKTLVKRAMGQLRYRVPRPQRPKRVQRKRGYTDKGSARSQTLKDKLELLNDDRRIRTQMAEENKQLFYKGVPNFPWKDNYNMPISQTTYWYFRLERI